MRKLSVPLSRSDAANAPISAINWSLIALTLCIFGCTSGQPRLQDATAQKGTQAVADQAVWQFDFVDTNDESLGYLLLAFTQERIDEPTCGNDYWKKLVVVEDHLDYEFGVESRPAYFVNGPWLTIDLTASICYIGHKLIGDISKEGASGFFNFSHKLGGYNIGRFTARPYLPARHADSEDVRG